MSSHINKIGNQLKMKKLLLFLFLIPNLAVAESYLCIAEASGGVEYNKSQKKFQGTGFNTDAKYILKKDGVKWIFSRFGKEPTELEECKEYSLENEVYWISCKIIAGRFHMNLKPLRFYRTYTAGYLPPKKNEPVVDTPFIEVGSCSSI